MKHLLMITGMLVLLAHESFAQAEASAEAYFGSDSNGKWYEVAHFSFSGSTYNSGNIEVKSQYVNTWTRATIEMSIRIRKSKDGLHSDWQYRYNGVAGDWVKLVSDGADNMKLFLYSNGTWGRAATEVRAAFENEGATTISLASGTITEADPNQMSPVTLAREYYYPVSTVVIGDNQAHYGYDLAVAGKIKAQEIKVTTADWADFVFEDDYVLRPLAEVEAFIQQNGHLPDVPSAAEVEQEGVNVGETNALLLQKIEELTLYILEQEKRIKALETARETN